MYIHTAASGGCLGVGVTGYLYTEVLSIPGSVWGVCAMARCAYTLPHWGCLGVGVTGHLYRAGVDIHGECLGWLRPWRSIHVHSLIGGACTY